MPIRRQVLNVTVGTPLGAAGARAAAALRAAGPLTVAELARRLGRDDKNLHTDVTQLIEWMAVERMDDGRVNVPWSEIVVDMNLPERAAA